MDDPSQRQVDSDIERSMDLFRRADVGTAHLVEGMVPKRVIVALDGSDQDYPLVLLAQQLHDRLRCQVGFHTIAADDFHVTENNLRFLKEIDAQEVSTPAELENNYDRILAAVDSFNADFLIAPCPFGRDFKSLGEDSTGTVMDVLTARSKVPFVAIRRPDATGRDPTSHLRLVLTGENPAAETAARWAVGLVQPNGRLELLLLVEQSFYANFRDTMARLQPDAEYSYEDLERALAKKYAQLHAGLRHAATSIGFTYELMVRYEADEKPITPEDPKTHPALMVLAAERNDHDSQGEVHDFIRRSPHPVLVVSIE